MRKRIDLLNAFPYYLYAPTKIMDRYEHTTLEKLDTEIVIAALGYPVQMVGPVEVECWIGGGKVCRVVALDGLTFAGVGMKVQLSGRFDMTELVDLEALAQQIEAAKAD